jgi:mono/diheme cytochrome c family protein
MTDLSNKFSALLLNGLLVAALALVTACGQKPPADEVVIDEAPAMAELEVIEPGVQSIDADGNVAPFGMASKKPVPVAELQVVKVTEGPATSALFAANCSACHGADALGVQGLGLNLVESELVANSSEAELVVFLQAGRLPDSPDSVTGIPMPSFAWMSEADLTEISGHLKSLQ